MIEILILNLKPGAKEKFHKLYLTLALPLLLKWNFEVVAHGPTMSDEDSYYVIRSFKSLDDRLRAEDAFYSSDDWLKGPREPLFELVQNYSYTVISTETFKTCANLIK